MIKSCKPTPRLGVGKPLGAVRTYGILFLVLISLTAVRAQTNYIRLISFDSVPTMGSAPSVPLIQGANGTLYGVTSGGGTNSGGTVFSIRRDGTCFSTLYSFTNGPFFFGGLEEGVDGMLYGTRTGGGANNNGVVFKLSEDGSVYSTLHSFTGTNGGVDGSSPAGPVLQGSDGFLYGTTQIGGSNNLGTVFRLDTNGISCVVLHHFLGNTNGDGSSPFGGLVQGPDGFLYGTTSDGGTNSFGTIFKISTNGGSYSILHHFCGSGVGDGRRPMAGLLFGQDGQLYGTTQYGGSNDLGTAYGLSADGASYAILHVFVDTAFDGEQPWDRLVQGPGGMLYGTTRFGGASGLGTVFTLCTNSSNYALLHHFGSTGDGSQPLSGLAACGNGGFFGVTFFGGNTGNGCVFKLFSGTPQLTITSISKSAPGTLLTFKGGAAGATYKIQASTNMGTTNGWVVIGSTNAAIDGSFSFVDTGVSNQSARYYRGAIP